MAAIKSLDSRVISTQGATSGIGGSGAGTAGVLIATDVCAVPILEAMSVYEVGINVAGSGAADAAIGAQSCSFMSAVQRGGSMGIFGFVSIAASGINGRTIVNDITPFTLNKGQVVQFKVNLESLVSGIPYIKGRTLGTLPTGGTTEVSSVA
jgi:hypothetical protein